MKWDISDEEVEKSKINHKLLKEKAIEIRSRNSALSEALLALEQNPALILANKSLSDEIRRLEEKQERLLEWLDKRINRPNARADVWSAEVTKCYERVRELLK